MSKYLSYDDIPKEVAGMIVNDIKRMNCECKQIVRLSRNPNDYYLFLVMAKKNAPIHRDAAYVVWLYNSSVGGLCEGCYDITLKDAYEVLARKMI